MTTYMSMEVPFSTNRIAFKGENIKFDAKGIRGAKMKALKDFKINISSQTVTTKAFNFGICRPKN